MPPKIVHVPTGPESRHPFGFTWPVSPRPAGSEGFYVGGSPRTPTVTTREPSSTAPSIREIQQSLPYKDGSFIKLPLSFPQSPQPVVLKPGEALPWAEVDSENYMLVLTRGNTVGVLQLPQAIVADATESLKQALALAIKMDLKMGTSQVSPEEYSVTASIIGGKKVDPWALMNNLKQFCGVSEKIQRYPLPENGHFAVAIDTFGYPLLLTDVPSELLKPREQTSPQGRRDRN